MSSSLASSTMCFFGMIEGLDLRCTPTASATEHKFSNRREDSQFFMVMCESRECRYCLNLRILYQAVLPPIHTDMSDCSISVELQAGEDAKFQLACFIV
jgi:hypothetical protein